MRKKYIAAGLAGLMLVSSLIMNVNAGQLDPGVESESANIPTETIMNDDGKANTSGKWYEHVFATEALSTEAEEVTKQADVYGYIGNYNKDKTNGGTVGYFDIHGDQKTATAYVGDEDPKDADMVLSDPKFISVTVPMDICLLLVQKAADADNKVRNGVFLSPQYKIENKGSKVGVYIDGVEKQTVDSFLDIQMDEELTNKENSYKLVVSPVTSSSEDSKNVNAFTFTNNIVLKDKVDDKDNGNKLGTLDKDGIGYFTFTGTADAKFFEKDGYIDKTFPTASDLVNANAHIKANPRSNYKLMYKFVLEE